MYRTVVARRASAVLLLAAALILLGAGSAAAHPLGNFTVNTADRLMVTAGGVQVTHVVDIAEIPSVQLRQARSGADSNGDGQLSPAELGGYAERECARIGPLLSLVVDGEPVELAVTSAAGEEQPGAAGLPITRIECSYATDQRPASSVAFADPVAEQRNGWREVSAGSECGSLAGSDVPAQSPSRLLAAYPEDLLQSPVDVTRASFRVQGNAACVAGLGAAAALSPDEVAPRGLDRLSQAFTGFLARPDLTPVFALVSLAAAVLFGVLHAVAPGHGKTVMAAYLVGQRGTRRQALQLGAIVTFTHTASVLLLGLVLSLGALAAPELVVPVTEVLAGVLLAAVGVYLTVLAVRRLRANSGHEHEHHGHEHGHHGHDHPPPADHHVASASGQQHDPDPHDQDAPHDHDHRTGLTPLSPAAGSVAVEARPVEHTHGGRTHTHAPLPEGRLTWKTLSGMGVAGGLVPSPSALLVLLSATALGRAWFGVLLVIAYGLGMAVTLTVAGLVILRARAVLDRRGWSLGRGRRLVALLPLATATVVVLVGLGLVLRGLATGRGLL